MSYLARLQQLSNFLSSNWINSKPLLFLADGEGYFDAKAEEQHLGGGQWGVMNETGSWPGQSWLWLFAF
jgi:hypothetical protein